MERVPIIQETDFLLIIDVQNDLLPGGANPVPDSEKIIEPIMRICPFFKKVMVAILCFEPGHPLLKKIRYCALGSCGAEYPDFPSKFRKDAFRGLVIRGNAKLAVNHLFSNGTVASEIKKLGTTRTFLCGLPLDTTIKEIALTFKDQGFEVAVFEDGTAPTGKTAGQFARQDLELAGIKFMRISQFFDS